MLQNTDNENHTIKILFDPLLLSLPINIVGGREGHVFVVRSIQAQSHPLPSLQANPAALLHDPMHGFRQVEQPNVSPVFRRRRN